VARARAHASLRELLLHAAVKAPDQMQLGTQGSVNLGRLFADIQALETSLSLRDLVGLCAPFARLMQSAVYAGSSTPQTAPTENEFLNGDVESATLDGISGADAAASSIAAHAAVFC
jgi:hypothetical protein